MTAWAQGQALVGEQQRVGKGSAVRAIGHIATARHQAPWVSFAEPQTGVAAIR